MPQNCDACVELESHEMRYPGCGCCVVLVRLPQGDGLNRNVVTDGDYALVSFAAPVVSSSEK